MQPLHALLQVFDLRIGESTGRIALSRQQATYFRIPARIGPRRELHDVVVASAEAQRVGRSDSEGERTRGGRRAGQATGRFQRHSIR
ncbi:hypothetical protein G6F32_016609 [Rhizopus arrhizus]|nr:hypothetical protein G6F32_016609 [Rhizopus arrhizus]